MDSQFKETFGSWTQAIGTVISAVAGTPSNVLGEEFREKLDLIGNELQATGNAILADAEETWSLNKFGNVIQAIGNSTVILGLVIDFDEVTKQELIIKGNLIQALGGVPLWRGHSKIRMNRSRPSMLREICCRRLGIRCKR